MVINLKQLYDIVGEKLILDYAVDIQELNALKGYSFSRPLTINGAIVNRAGVVTLNYTAAFTLHACCDRCLIEFDRDYSFDFEHVIVRSMNGDNDEYVVTEFDKLDMDELALTDCLLQLPSKMLCKEDCLGLCPHCGTDLNENECDCNG